MTNLDREGKAKYDQLKGEISPKVSCNVNSICCAYECKHKEWPTYIKNYKPEYKRIPDKLIWFLRNDLLIRELYKKINIEYYNKWINDKTKDKDLYSDNSYPPNELMKILCIGFNLFMNLNNGDNYKNYCELKELTTEEIIETIKSKSPIVSSFNLNNFGHIMTIVGENTTSILVEDSYGMSYLKEHNQIDKAKEIPLNEFKKICKPIENEKKLCIVF